MSGGPYCYDYPRPMVTVDLVVFALAEDGLRSLFIRRKKAPFAGHWAIPGGFVEIDEPIEAAARRELKEETGLDAPALVETIGVFGDPGRDPRGRTISIAHAAVIPGPPPEVAGGDDAKDAAWLDPAKVEHLAFDHAKILTTAREWLAQASRRDEIALGLLPDTFGTVEVGRMLKAVGISGGPARWIASRRRAGRIEEIAGSAGRFRTTTRAQ